MGSPVILVWRVALVGLTVYRHCGALEMTIAPKTVAIDSTTDVVIPSTVELSCSLPHMVLNGTGYTLEVQGLRGTASQHACAPSQGIVLCSITFKEPGTQRLALYTGDGELLEASTIQAFAQPAAVYVRPLKLSFAGSDPFSLKLEVDTLPVGDTDLLDPIIRFEHDGMVWTVSPTVSTDEEGVFLIGLSPSFAINAAEIQSLSGIKVFYSLNGIQFSQALSKHGEVTVVSMPTFKVGFIYHMTPDFENGFVYAQNEARLGLTVSFPGRVETNFVQEKNGFGPDQCGEPCGGPDGWCTNFAPCANYVPSISHNCYVEGKRMLDELGYDMIVGTTFEYWPDLRQLAIEHPDKHVVGTSPGGIPPPGWQGVTASNLGAARSKLWQGIYMQGYALGLHPEVRKNPRVGYITSFPSIVFKDETAVFAKGLREGGGGMIDFMVYEVQIFSWYHPMRERIAAQRLFKYFNISAISTLCNSMEAYTVAKEFNGYSTALNVDAMPVVGKSVVVSQISNWKRQLERFVNAALANVSWWVGSPDGTGMSAPGRDLIYGADQDGWSLTMPSPTLPALQQRQLRDRMEEFQAGSDDIFCNTIRVFGGTKQNISMYGGLPGTCRTDCLLPARCDWAAFWKNMGIKSTCSDEEKIYNPTIKDRFCYVGPMNVSHDVPDSCAPGFVLSMVGCEACPVGKSHDASSDVCVNCEAGAFADTSGALSCDSCPVGKFVAVQASTSCSVCEPGKFAEKVGSTECRMCSPGTFQASEGDQGVTECSFCPRGKYANSTGSTECMDCPIDKTTAERGSVHPDACICGEGAYPVGSACTPCPQGLACHIGQELPVTLPGFMMLPEGEIGAYKCTDLSRCPGGMGRGECAYGFVGIACSICPTGENSGMGDAESGCQVCSSVQSGAIVIGWFLIFLIPIYVYYNANKALFFSSRNVHVVAGLVAIASSAFQVLGIISSFSLEMTLSGGKASAAQSIGKVIESITLIDGDQWFSTNCSYGSDPVIKYGLRCTAIYTTMLLFYAYLMFSKLGPETRQWKNALAVNAMASLLATFSITLFKTAMEPMMCYSHPIGEASLTKYPNILCGSEKHVVMLLMGTSLLLSALAFFAFVMKITMRFPHQHVFRKKFQGDDFLKLSRFVHNNFAPSACFWRIVQLIRAVCLSLCTVVFPNDAHAQIMACLFVLLIPMMLSVHFRPWRVSFLNELDNFVGLLTIAILVLASCFLEKAENASTYSWMYVAMLLIIFLCFVGALLKLISSYFTKGEKFSAWKVDKPTDFFMKSLKSKRFEEWRLDCAGVMHARAIGGHSLTADEIQEQEAQIHDMLGRKSVGLSDLELRLAAMYGTPGSSGSSGQEPSAQANEVKEIALKHKQDLRSEGSKHILVPREPRAEDNEVNIHWV